MPEISTHPSGQALALFGQGRLPEPQATAVSAHLETCADCRDAVAGLPPDSFEGKLHAARPGTSSPPAARPISAASVTGKGGAPAAAPANVPPELANHPKFRIVRELGRGGMGVIYQAEHRVMEKLVALKVISPAVLDNPEALARFHAEVVAAGKLDHQNIARAYDADQAGGLHFLVMEFVEGTDLARLVEKKGPLPVANACHYARQAALGLQHASAKGMVHRDIKPHNLMLTPQGLVKVLDFGLARMRSERPAAPRMTRLESFMGTPEYVAPEQALDARKADTRADIYSLGCALYCLLAGRPPFVGETATQLVMAHIEREPQPLHELRPDVPPELSAVVAKMLAKDPAQRDQRPVEAAQALVPFVKAGKAGAAGSAPVSAPAASAGTGTRVGGDTSRGKSLGGKPPAKAAPVGPDEEEKAAPFAGLGDAAAAAPAPRTAKRERKEQKPAPLWKRPPALAGAGVVLLLLGLVILWAAGVLTVKTADGTIVLENLPADADVLVDGKKVTVTWGTDRKSAEITVRPGSHQIAAKQGAVEVIGDTVEIKEGGRSVLTARVIPPVPPEGHGTKPPVAPDPDRKAAAFVLPDDGLPSWMATDCEGKMLAVPCGDRVVLFDAHTGKLLRTLTGNTGRVYCVTFSPDGKRLVACNGWGDAKDHTIRTWNAETGAAGIELAGHTQTINTVAYSLDGKRIVTASNDGTAIVWNEAGGRGVVFFKGHDGAVGSAAFSPDGKRVVTGGLEDQTVRVWDAADGKVIKSLPGHTERVSIIAFSPDGKLLASGSENELRLWEADTLKEVRTIKTRAAWLAFAPDGKSLLAGAHNNSNGSQHVIKRWSLEGKELAMLTLEGKGGWAAYCLSADGKTLFEVGITIEDRKLRAYDAETGKVRRTAPEPTGIAPDRNAAEYAAEFKPLFNGKDLKGWKVEGTGTNSWKIEDGVIVARGSNWGQRTYLLSDREYANYILRLDFNLEKDANSGIALRALPGELLPHGSNQVMLFDHPILKLSDGPVLREQTGSMIWMGPPGFNKPNQPAELRSPNEWNQLEIEVNGRAMTAKLNGEELFRAVADENARMTRDILPGLNRVKGRVGLENHSGTVRFRKLDIKELPPK